MMGKKKGRGGERVTTCVLLPRGFVWSSSPRGGICRMPWWVCGEEVVLWVSVCWEARGWEADVNLCLYAIAKRVW